MKTALSLFLLASFALLGPAAGTEDPLPYGDIVLSEEEAFLDLACGPETVVALFVTALEAESGEPVVLEDAPLPDAWHARGVLLFRLETLPYKDGTWTRFRLRVGAFESPEERARAELLLAHMALDLDEIVAAEKALAEAEAERAAREAAAAEAAAGGGGPGLEPALARSYEPLTSSQPARSWSTPPASTSAVVVYGGLPVWAVGWYGLCAPYVWDHGAWGLWWWYPRYVAWSVYETRAGWSGATFAGGWSWWSGPAWSAYGHVPWGACHCHLCLTHVIVHVEDDAQDDDDVPAGGGSGGGDDLADAGDVSVPPTTGADDGGGAGGQPPPGVLTRQEPRLGALPDGGIGSDDGRPLAGLGAPGLGGAGSAAGTGSTTGGSAGPRGPSAMDDGARRGPRSVTVARRPVKDVLAGDAGRVAAPGSTPTLRLPVPREQPATSRGWEPALGSTTRGNALVAPTSGASGLVLRSAPTLPTTGSSRGTLVAPLKSPSSSLSPAVPSGSLGLRLPAPTLVSPLRPAPGGAPALQPGSTLRMPVGLPTPTLKVKGGKGRKGASLGTPRTPALPTPIVTPTGSGSAGTSSGRSSRRSGRRRSPR